MSESETSSWHDLGVAGLFQNKVFDIGTDEIWATYDGNYFRAVSNVCSHMMGPLSEGVVENEVVECPWHGYRFQMNTGLCMSEDKRCPSLRVYETKIEDGRLFVRGVIK